MVSIGFYSRYEQCLVKAVTPKTQLLEPKSWCGPLRAEESQPRNSFVMKIVKRYLQKGETADLSESLRARCAKPWSFSRFQHGRGMTPGWHGMTISKYFQRKLHGWLHMLEKLNRITRIITKCLERIWTRIFFLTQVYDCNKARVAIVGPVSCVGLCLDMFFHCVWDIHSIPQSSSPAFNHLLKSKCYGAQLGCQMPDGRISGRLDNSTKQQWGSGAGANRDPATIVIDRGQCGTGCTNAPQNSATLFTRNPSVS